MIEVYCDESRPEVIFGDKSKDRYMVIGGVWIPYSYRNDVKDKFKCLKSEYGVNGEVKWNNVSPSKLDFYLQIIDLFFQNPVQFRCIVVDSKRVDIHNYHDDDNELGFYKFYYQMLIHWLNEREDYWIYLDYKKNKLPNRLHTLKNILNNSTFSVVKSVQAIDSKQSVLIQMADLLIGAVGYKYHNLTGSEAKLKLIERIEENLGHKIGGTTKGTKKFNVFKIALRGRV